MGDIEKAKREIRYAKSAADDRRWDLLETRIRGIEAALEGVSDAERAPVLAEIRPMRDAMARALREEQATRIEREIKRNLSNAEDGSEAQLEKALNRLAQPDARESLAAETVQRLQAEIARIQAKLGIAISAPPAAAAPAQVRPAPQAAAPAVLSDEARAIQSDVERTLMFAAEDVERDPDRAESRIEKVVARLDSPEAKQHVPADLMARLRAHVAGLRTKMEGGRQAERIGRIEEQLARFIGSAEQHLSQRPWMSESALKLAVARIESDDVKRILPAPKLERFRGDIARIQAQIVRQTRESALDRALPILRELEERVAGKFFDDHQPAWACWATWTTRRHGCAGRSSGYRRMTQRCERSKNAWPRWTSASSKLAPHSMQSRRAPE